ncbi:MAG: multiheme c-type cytochrome [Calditrichaceae bacterium]
MYIIKILSFILISSMIFAEDYTLETVDDCAACHDEIAQQWQSSMHALSTLDKDVLYRGMYEWAKEDTQGKITKKCKNCHTPYFYLSDTILVTKEVRERSVDCLYCHSIDSLHMEPKFSSMKYAANDNDLSDFHIVKERSHFENEKLCMQCHAELTNPNQVAICTTGDEFYNQSESQSNCQSCHMPKVKGYKSAESDSASDMHAHTFSGPHSKDFLKGSLKLSAEVKENKLIIAVDNSKTPHSYPTGTPLRMVILKVIGLNQEGKIVYQNWHKNPVAEDKKAVFARMFADEKDNMPSPPWRAVKVGHESRLKPGEVRKINYALPEGIKTVSAKLFFQLAPAPILAKLKIDDPYLKTPHLIDEITMELN